MLLFAIVLGCAALMMALEHLLPGREFPKVKGWWLRALTFNGAQAFILWGTGELWNTWFQAHRLWSLSNLGPVNGALVGYVLHSFVYYWWHRWRHEVGFLWRWVHQLHHSPVRIEVITSFYKHPIELLLNSLISSTVLYVVMGLSPEQAFGTMLLSGLGELWYHFNVRTPHWMGYLIQRPESHCVHHQEELHAFNYGDLPIFDILFGTFQNPRTWQGRCGFGDGQEQRVNEMLVGVDINAEEPSTVGARSR
jgi:sterol desaturase/sphingolipid hydroxylase (fatty acid hydroxylase superfamily)